MDPNLPYASSTLVLLTKNSAHRFDNVHTWGAGGPPGGDAPPCDPKLTSTAVSWDCYEGLEWDEKKNEPSSVADRITYRLPLNGGAVSTHVYKVKW